MTQQGNQLLKKYIPNQNAFIYPSGKIVTTYELECVKDDAARKELGRQRRESLHRAEKMFIKEIPTIERGNW